MLENVFLAPARAWMCTRQRQSKSIGNYPRNRIARGTRNVLDVAILMDGLAVFVGMQIDA